MILSKPKLTAGRGHLLCITMNTQGAVEVPSNLPVTAFGEGNMVVGPCSGIWDGSEKGWTLVQSARSKAKAKAKARGRGGRGQYD